MFLEKLLDTRLMQSKFYLKDIPLRLYCTIFSELGVRIGTGGGAPRGGMGGLSVPSIAEFC